MSGCEGKPDDGPPPLKMDAAAVDVQVKKIEADPNMTPQAKEAAIAGLKRAAESAAAGQPAGKPSK